MESIGHIPTFEQKKAHERLRCMAGNIIDDANKPDREDGEDTRFDAYWDEDCLHFDLSSVTIVDADEDEELFSTPYGNTRYFLQVESSLDNREEYFTFGSADYFVYRCDEGWNILDGRNDNQRVLLEKLTGYLETYRTASYDKTKFNAVVMNFLMSDASFERTLRKLDGNEDAEERIIQMCINLEPELDTAAVKAGLETYFQGVKQGNPAPTYLVREPFSAGE